jgi:desulfoferrodoxin (superoxide reductase-like protein)
MVIWKIEIKNAKMILGHWSKYNFKIKWCLINEHDMTSKYFIKWHKVITSYVQIEYISYESSPKVTKDQIYCCDFNLGF